MKCPNCKTDFDKQGITHDSDGVDCLKAQIKNLRQQLTTVVRQRETLKEQLIDTSFREDQKPPNPPNP